MDYKHNVSIEQFIINFLTAQCKSQYILCKCTKKLGISTRVGMIVDCRDATVLIYLLSCIITTCFSTFFDVLWSLPGAYEPAKAAKEHAIRFHHNPNYVTHLKKINLRNARVQLWFHGWTSNYIW